jgi:hypothetical protein
MLQCLENKANKNAEKIVGKTLQIVTDMFGLLQ